MTITEPSVGIVLHSHKTAEEANRDLGSEFRRTVEAAVEVGADTLWVWDHMLRASVYREPWHDPLISLAAVADSGLRLGTGVLVAPVRPPVQTALAISTIQSLSGKPMRLGIGTGWNPREFEAAGVPLKHRGKMTDEFLDVLDAVFSGESNFEGRFFGFSDLEAGHVGPPPEIWIGGGTRKAGRSTDASDKSTADLVIPEPVANRITRYGRWLIRPSATVDDYRRDIAAMSARLGGDEPDHRQIATSILMVAHIVETDDPTEARDTQAAVFNQLMTGSRPLEYLEQSYLLGSLPEIRTRLAGWSEMGMEHVGLYLLGDVPAQVELFAKHFGDLLEFRSP